MPDRYRPANGTEGDLFELRFCAKCWKDQPYRATNEIENGCQILARMLAFPIEHKDYPDELQYGPYGQPTCTAFDRIKETPTDGS